MSYFNEIKALAEKKTKLVKDADVLLKKENRSAEDETQVRSLHTEANKVREQIELLQAQDGLDKSIEERISRVDSVKTADGAAINTTPEYRKAYWNAVRYYDDPQAAAEFRAVSSIGAGAEPAAGFVPASFADRYVQVVTSYQGMNNAGVTIYDTSDGRSLPIPKINDTAETGGIVAEHSASSDLDTLDPVTTQVVLGDFNVDSHIARVSTKLMRDSAFPIEQFLGNELFIRVARKWNSLLTVGAGTTEPRGVVLDAGAGVTAAEPTSISFSELRDLENSVDVEYRQRGDLIFMAHQNTINVIKKLTDDDGRPIFGVGDITKGAPDTLLGYRLVNNNAMDTIAANKKCLLFGWFGAYAWRRVGGPVLEQFNELYKATHEVGFRVSHSGDGALCDATAVKYLLTNVS